METFSSRLMSIEYSQNTEYNLMFVPEKSEYLPENGRYTESGWAAAPSASLARTPISRQVTRKTNDNKQLVKNSFLGVRFKLRPAKMHTRSRKEGRD